MPKPETFRIAEIYVPVKRRGAVDPHVVRELAESILEIGQQTPIVVRRDADRVVLIEGLHRLEACKALGEETIVGCVADGEAGRPRPLSTYEAQAEALRQKTERLRMLRLEKQAAEKSFAPLATPPDGTGAATARNPSRHPGNGSALSKPAKPANLSEWLAEMEHDGFRH